MRTLLLASVVLATGCQTLTASSCDCLVDGPDVDFTQMKEPLDDLTGNHQEGTFTDGAEDPSAAGYTACSVAGQPYSLELLVDSEPTCYDSEGVETACTAAKQAWYHILPDLAFGDDGSLLFEGSLGLASTEGGVTVYDLSFTGIEGGFPYETFEAEYDATVPYGELWVDEFTWGRRTTEDNAAQAVWQVCTLRSES